MRGLTSFFMLQEEGRMRGLTSFFMPQEDIHDGVNFGDDKPVSAPRHRCVGGVRGTRRSAEGGSLKRVLSFS
jgi:hypothetical protein